MSTLTLSKCGTNKTTATYATLGTNAQSTNLNYNAQLTPINTAAYLANQQPQSSRDYEGYQEIGLTYDLATGGLATGGGLKLAQTPHHLTTFLTTISSDKSSDNEDSHHAIQVYFLFNYFQKKRGFNF